MYFHVHNMERHGADVDIGKTWVDNLVEVSKVGDKPHQPYSTTMWSRGRSKRSVTSYPHCHISPSMLMHHGVCTPHHHTQPTATLHHCCCHSSLACHHHCHCLHAATAAVYAPPSPPSMPCHRRCLCTTTAAIYVLPQLPSTRCHSCHLCAATAAVYALPQLLSTPLHPTCHQPCTMAYAHPHLHHMQPTAMLHHCHHCSSLACNHHCCCLCATTAAVYMSLPLHPTCHWPLPSTCCCRHCCLHPTTTPL